MSKRRDWIIKQLRRTTYRCPERDKALKDAIRKDGVFAINKDGDRSRIKYECNMCKLLYRRKEIQLDHVVPIIPVEGFDDWNGVVPRMFVQCDGYQVLCKTCHKEKTNDENVIRREERKSEE